MFYDKFCDELPFDKMKKDTCNKWQQLACVAILEHDSACETNVLCMVLHTTYTFTQVWLRIKKRITAYISNNICLLLLLLDRLYRVYLWWQYNERGPYTKSNEGTSSHQNLPATIDSIFESGQLQWWCYMGAATLCCSSVKKQL